MGLGPLPNYSAWFFHDRQIALKAGPVLPQLCLDTDIQQTTRQSALPVHGIVNRSKKNHHKATPKLSREDIRKLLEKTKSRPCELLLGRNPTKRAANLKKVKSENYYAIKQPDAQVFERFPTHVVVGEAVSVLNSIWAYLKPYSGTSSCVKKNKVVSWAEAHGDKVTTLVSF